MRSCCHYRHKWATQSKTPRDGSQAGFGWGSSRTIPSAYSRRKKDYFLAFEPAAFTAAEVAADTPASVNSAACFAALFRLSNAELAAFTACFTAARATSEPNGEALAVFSASSGAA